MVFRRLRDLVSRQAQAAASKVIANTQLSSDDEQPEPTLVCSPGSSRTAVEVPVTVVTNKGQKRKRQVSKSEGDEVPATIATGKSCKRRKQIPEIQENPDPFELINFFSIPSKCLSKYDKHFEGIEKKLQQPSNKKTKMEEILKFKQKGNTVQFQFNNIVYKLFKIFRQR